MGERDSDYEEERAISLQRLAILQRLRDEAHRGNRASMLESIDKLISQERKSLRARDRDDETV